MNAPLLIAGVLAVAGGIVHSYMGERLILIPLLRGDGIPETPFGDARFTKVMLRAVWHFFAVIVWSTAGLFLAAALGFFSSADRTSLRIITLYWAIFAVVTLVLSRGRHFAWALG